MITFSTPFAGKRHCFSKYTRGIKNLDWPKGDIFYLAIDNSNDEAFGKKIDDFAKEMNFGGYKRYVYEKPHFTIENTEDYALVSQHCHEVYQIMEKYLPENEYTFNVEDDIELPPEALAKLMEIFNRYPNVGTAVGASNSRRMNDRLVGHPIVWRFRQEKVWPYADILGDGEVEAIRFQSAPPFGIQIIGSAHMGCWLTKTKLIKSISFKDLEGMIANDLAWGYKLAREGYHMVIDWSVKTKHWWDHDGERGYY